MATVGKATRLDNLRTDGVAMVKRGANNRRIALAKNGDDVDETIEALFLELIAKGDMEMDEQAVEDMCAQAGLDPQATETFKAIMKLAYAYRDSDAMKGLLKTVFAQAAAPQKPGAPGQPGMPAQAGAQPGAQPGAPQPGMPGQGAQAQPGQGQPPAPGQTQAGGAPPAPNPGEGKPPPPGAKEGEPAGNGEGKPPMKPGAGEEPAAGEGETPAEGDDPDKKKNPFSKNAPPSAKESDMDEKKVAELVAKAAADAKAEADKKIAEQEAVIKSQEVALKANTDAVKKMQDDLRLSQWVSKAEKELGFISGQTAEELGKTLFDIDTHNPELAKKQFDILKAQNAVVKSSGMFRPIGATGVSKGASNNALEEIEKRTAEIVAKSAGTGKSAEVLKAEAQLAVMKADPALYKRYCDEQEAINREALAGQIN